MPNVTIDINGRGSNGMDSNRGNSNNTSSSQQQDNRQQQTAPPDNRLVEELRKMLMEQASRTKENDRYTPMIERMGQMQRQQMTQQYDDRRKNAQDKMTSRYEEIDRQIDASIDKEVYDKGLTSDEDVQKVMDKYKEERNKLYEKAGQQYDKEIADIDKEQTEKEEELTRAIEELTEEVRKSGGQINPNSYLSQLREQRQKAIIDRDNAADEDSAREAAARVRDLDRQIRSVELGDQEEDKKDIDWGLRTIQTIMGFDSLARGIAGRDLGSIVMGGAQTITSMLGLSDRGAARALAWVKPIATIGTLLTQEAQKSDQMAGLAALVRNDRQIGGGDIGSTREALYRNLWDYDPTGTGGIYSFGLSVPEFAQQAQQRIRQRGIVNNGISEAYFQEALERVFSLNQGALGQAGRYDRYGTNATDAFSNLISRLERISNSGVSQGNYVRAQEYLDMQQALMQQYMQFQNNPNVGIANKEIEAFAKLKNYTVDNRTAGEIGAVRGMITSPQNDRMRAILYSTVEELMPETAGRSDLIDRAINDPAKQGEIIRAYMRRIQNMYGGTNTPMGYWAARNALSSIPVGRLDSIWNGIIGGEAGRTLANGSIVNSRGNTGEKMQYAAQAKDYASGTTQILINMSDGIFAGISLLEEFATDVKDLLTKQISLFEFVKNRF